jgi:hypothetical protein
MEDYGGVPGTPSMWCKLGKRLDPGDLQNKHSTLLGLFFAMDCCTQEKSSTWDERAVKEEHLAGIIVEPRRRGRRSKVRGLSE